MAQDQFEFFQMRCFIAVAEELSFRRAAHRLNMTQPPLSRQIKLLEERINLRLFDRSNRHVQLTSAGESFYQSALDIRKRSEQAVLTARQAERGESGNVVLGYVPSAALKFIPLIVKSLTNLMPNVSLTPVEMMGYEVVDSQRSGRIDLGLTRMEQQRVEIERTRVVSEPFVVAIPKTHRLAYTDKLLVSDLDGEPYISFTTDSGGYIRETLAALFAACSIVPDVKIEASQTHTVISLVNQGIGFAIVPRSARVMKMENIVYRDIDLPRQFRSDMYLVSRANQSSSVSMRVKELIIDVLKEYNETDKTR